MTLVRPRVTAARALLLGAAALQAAGCFSVRSGAFVDAGGKAGDGAAAGAGAGGSAAGGGDGGGSGTGGLAGGAGGSGSGTGGAAPQGTGGTPSSGGGSGAGGRGGGASGGSGSGGRSSSGGSGAGGSGGRSGSGGAGTGSGTGGSGSGGAAGAPALGPPVLEAYIKASNTGAGDLFGTAIALDGDTLAVGAPAEQSNSLYINAGDQNDNSLTDAGAVYVFVRTAGTWSQQAYIKPRNPRRGNRFGSTVALAGDWLLVGAPLEDGGGTGFGAQDSGAVSDSGAAYLFQRMAGVWTQAAFIKSSSPRQGAHFGAALSVSSRFLVIGAPLSDASNYKGDLLKGAGLAQAYELFADGWKPQGGFDALGVYGVGQANDHFASSVAVAGDVVAVGVPDEDYRPTLSSGGVYVYKYVSGDPWTETAHLTNATSSGGADPERFGGAVAVSGNLVVAGAVDSRYPGTDPVGAARLYEWLDNRWASRKVLLASNKQTGDAFGYAVAVSAPSGLIVVGAPQEDSAGGGAPTDDSAANAGAAYVFTGGGTSWTELALLKATNVTAEDRFGSAVAASGATIAVAAPLEDSAAAGVGGDPNDETAPDSGAVYVYRLPPVVAAPR